MRFNRDYSRMNDPSRNAAFNRGRRWRFYEADPEGTAALVAQAQRDLEARRRLRMPVPRITAAPWTVEHD